MNIADKDLWFQGAHLPVVIWNSEVIGRGKTFWGYCTSGVAILLDRGSIRLFWLVRPEHREFLLLGVRVCACLSMASAYVLKVHSCQKGRVAHSGPGFERASVYPLRGLP